MATRSLITVKTVDKNLGDVYETVYCHWDGYPDHMLGKLKAYYNNFDKVKDLMVEGDRSTIEPDAKLYNQPSTQVVGLHTLVKTAWDCNAEWVYLYNTDMGKWQYFEPKDPSKVDILYGG